MSNVYIIGDKDYLMHHGIKGQKWGVENGPPYPLNPSKDYSKAEQKALLKDVKNKYKRNDHRSKDSYYDIQNIKSIKNEIDSDQIKQLKNDILQKIKVVNQANKPFEKVNYDSSKLTKSQISAYRKAKDDVDVAWNNYHNYANKVVSNLVGKYGNVKLSKPKTMFDKYYNKSFEHEIRRAIDFAVENDLSKDSAYSYYANEVEKW